MAEASKKIIELVAGPNGSGKTTFAEPLCTRWYLFDNSGKSPELMMENEQFASLPQTAQDSYVKHFLKGQL